MVGAVAHGAGSACCMVVVSAGSPQRPSYRRYIKEGNRASLYRWRPRKRNRDFYQCTLHDKPVVPRVNPSTISKFYKAEGPSLLQGFVL